MAQQPNGLGRPLSALLPSDVDTDDHEGPLFSLVEGDPVTGVLEAALDLLTSALPADLCGFTAGHVSRLGSAADAEAAWALADILRRVARQQLPASEDTDGIVHLAVPCGPEASIGVRRVGAHLTQRETLLVQALGAVCTFATPAPSRPRLR